MSTQFVVGSGFVLAAMFLFEVCPALHGQEDQPTFRTEVKVVNVLATVRNKRGSLIRDLGKDDFSLSEDGRPQAIRYFSQQSDLPLTLGLMVDTSMSQARVMEAERGACFRFLDQVLRENKDQVFIMQFDMAVILRQELTSSLRRLNDALSFVDTPTRRDLEAQTGGGTLLYDAVIQAAKDIMKNRTGRKALIVLSDGVDIGSEATLEDAIAAAERSDTLVYSIVFSDPGAYGLARMMGIGGPDGKAALERLSRETGGGCFEVSRKLGLDQIFAELQDELRSQYNIGYVSDEPVSISEFRKIRLTVREKGLVVQARNRYWAQR
jgi:VWFA-related protein